VEHLYALVATASQTAYLQRGDGNSKRRAPTSHFPEKIKKNYHFKKQISKLYHD
jgi:hypothetical protein